MYNGNHAGNTECAGSQAAYHKWEKCGYRGRLCAVCKYRLLWKMQCCADGSQAMYTGRSMGKHKHEGICKYVSCTYKRFKDDMSMRRGGNKYPKLRTVGYVSEKSTWKLY